MRPRIEPVLLSVLSDLDRGLRELGVPFAIVGALVPELLPEEGVVFNMAGFAHAVPHAVPTVIDGGPTLPLVPLPLYALLKLVAFSDRKAAKDLGGVLHCLEHYLEDDDRRYGVEYGAEGVPYEYTCAHLLGLDGRMFLDDALVAAVRAVLERFDEPDAAVVGIAAGERGRLVEDDQRLQVFELFRWYRLGLSL